MSLLSVGIPTWQTPREFLEYAIESVYAQEGFPEPIKVVVVCARDDPKIGWLPKRFPDAQVKWVKHHHVGVQHAEAIFGDDESKWIGVLDADDAWLPNRAAGILDTTNEVAVYSDLILCHADMRREKIRRTPSKVTPDSIFRQGRANTMADQAIFRRSALKKVRWMRIEGGGIPHKCYFTEKYHCWDLWIRLALEYGPDRFLKKSPTYLYRQWRGQIHRAEFQQEPFKSRVEQERKRFLEYWRQRL